MSDFELETPDDEDVSTLLSAEKETAAFMQRLAQKPFATEEDLRMYLVLDGQVVVQLDDRVFRLEPDEVPDRLDPTEAEEASAAIPYWDDANDTPELDGCESQVDRTALQTPVRDQLDRGTCVCFASLANLETPLKASLGEEVDLSEQYANWLYMLNAGSDWCADGLKTTLAAQYLSVDGVCMEALCPYEDAATVGAHCPAWPQPRAKSESRYGIGDYSLIDNLGINGPSIANPRYLEALLCHGHDIVFGVQVAWGKSPDAAGVFDVIRDRFGNPLKSRGGHAMLIVGYNRDAPSPYVICKNSWGTSVGAAGYYYLSYDYIRQYARYGYIVHRFRDDMPKHA
jgi:hypothetical protein